MIYEVNKSKKIKNKKGSSNGKEVVTLGGLGINTEDIREAVERLYISKVYLDSEREVKDVMLENCLIEMVKTKLPNEKDSVIEKAVLRHLKFNDKRLKEWLNESIIVVVDDFEVLGTYERWMTSCNSINFNKDIFKDYKKKLIDRNHTIEQDILEYQKLRAKNPKAKSSEWMRKNGYNALLKRLTKHFGLWSKFKAHYDSITMEK